MHTLLQLICFFAVLLRWTECDFFDNPCRITPNGLYDQHTTVDVNATLGCHNGSFYWEYPRGGVRVHFHYKGLPMFRVCLKDALGRSVFEIFDVTYNAQHELSVVTPDSPKEVCTSFHHSEVVILFQASEMMVYMGEVEYRIQPLYLPV